jgi:hypothetical protein
MSHGKMIRQHMVVATHSRNLLKWIDGHNFDVTLAMTATPNGGLLMLILRFLIVGIREQIFRGNFILSTQARS